MGLTGRSIDFTYKQYLLSCYIITPLCGLRTSKGTSLSDSQKENTPFRIKGHEFRELYHMAKRKISDTRTEPQSGAERVKETVIPVVEEQAAIGKKVVEAGNVRIKKRITEQTQAVPLPVINESYHVEHVVPTSPVVLDNPPPAVRYEGDKMIVTVLREVSVVQKKYEVIEEIHLTRRLSEERYVQEVTLRQEHVDVERRTNEDEHYEDPEDYGDGAFRPRNP